MWVRGLKLMDCDVREFQSRSHPMWVRGLKPHNLSTTGDLYPVAPYVGAWIETISGTRTWCGRLSHPMWVRGLKLKKFVKAYQPYGRTLCGCVD